MSASAGKCHGQGTLWLGVPALGLPSLAAVGGNPDPVGIRSLVSACQLPFSWASSSQTLPLFGPGLAKGSPWAIGAPNPA